MKTLYGPTAVPLVELRHDGMVIASNEGDLKGADGVLRPATDATVI